MAFRSNFGHGFFFGFRHLPPKKPWTNNRFYSIFCKKDIRLTAKKLAPIDPLVLFRNNQKCVLLGICGETCNFGAWGGALFC
jgi:hypothetical protein